MEELINTAQQYIGQTEKPGNSGFNDAEFERKMNAVGFQKTHAWCAYFAELVAKEAVMKALDKLFSASAVQTYKNFEEAGYTITDTPAEGTIVVWQRFVDGRPQWSGHVGIVKKVINSTTFISIEGNTNDQGGREGYIVAEHTRTTARVRTGLNILGFIHLK